ncbi:MAG: contractile injection system tape measure protein, partial [Bacteroidota bacterium]
RETETHWELTVKRNSYDILMNSLPFTLSPFKYKWMKKMMIVHWL